MSDKFDFTEVAIGRVFATFSDLITSCMRTHPVVQQSIFQPENSKHKELLAETLAQHQAIATKSAEKVKNSEQKQPQTWIEKRIAYANGLGVRWASPVAEKLASNPWFQALTMRERDALVLSRVAAPECEFRNLSHSSVSSTSSGSLIAPTMLPAQIMWIESQERLLTGFEALVLQRYPIVPRMCSCDRRRPLIGMKWFIFLCLLLAMLPPPGRSPYCKIERRCRCSVICTSVFGISESWQRWIFKAGAGISASLEWLETA